MKKILFTIAILAISATSVSAFEIPGAAEQKNKVQLQACLSTEAQNMLVSGKLNGKDVEAVAKELASTCAKKLAIQNDNQTITLATTVLKSVMK